MELRQLEYFVAVIEEGSFTRAAERVRITQSGISAQVRQLERELGAELIDRSTRVARPTPAGEAALDHARAALTASDSFQQAVAEVKGVIRGRVRIGMVIGCTVAPLFEGLAAFHEQHPGVELSLLEDASDQMIDAVRAGALDLALVGVAGAIPADLKSLTVVSDGLSAVVASDHPLADARSLTLERLAEHPLICMPAGTGIRTVLDRSLAAARLQPARILEASAADAIADLSVRGMGVGVLATSMAESYSDRLAAIAIRDVTTPALLAVVWSQRANPALRELVGQVTAAFGGAVSTEDALSASTSVP